MPDALKSRGFSLPEVMLAMCLMVCVVTALGGYYRALATSALQMNQYRQMWRYARGQASFQPPALPEGWRNRRVVSSSQPCVSINVTITTPMGRQGSLSRLHCPVSQ